jgi:hypothetical protein
MKIAQALLLIAICSLASCKKDDGSIDVSGNIINGTTGQVVPNADIRFLGKLIQNGAYGSNDATLSSATSNTEGHFSCSWKRSNIADLKMKIACDGFITRTINLDQALFDTERENTLSQTIYEEAIAAVHIVNMGNTHPSDQVNFTFYDTPFEDCVCCAEGWQYFTGMNIDTSFTCRAYGNSWLKYEVQINTLALDTVYRDSIWCPTQSTSPIEITY